MILFTKSTFITYREDSGNYTCIATSSEEAINATINVSVVVLPTFVISPADKEVIEGHSTILHCTAQGTCVLLFQCTFYFIFSCKRGHFTWTRLHPEKFKATIFMQFKDWCHAYEFSVAKKHFDWKSCFWKEPWGDLIRLELWELETECVSTSFFRLWEFLWCCCLAISKFSQPFFPSALTLISKLLLSFFEASDSRKRAAFRFALTIKYRYNIKVNLTI